VAGPWAEPLSWVGCADRAGTDRHRSPIGRDDFLTHAAAPAAQVPEVAQAPSGPGLGTPHAKPAGMPPDETENRERDRERQPAAVGAVAAPPPPPPAHPTREELRRLFLEHPHAVRVLLAL